MLYSGVITVAGPRRTRALVPWSSALMRVHTSAMANCAVTGAEPWDEQISVFASLAGAQVTRPRDVGDGQRIPHWANGSVTT